MRGCLPALWRPCWTVGRLLGHTAAMQLLTLRSRHRRLQASRFPVLFCPPNCFFVGLLTQQAPQAPAIRDGSGLVGRQAAQRLPQPGEPGPPHHSLPPRARVRQAAHNACIFRYATLCLLGDAAVGGSHPMPSCSPDRLHGFGLRSLYLAFTALLAGREQCTCRCGAGWRSWRHPAT